MMKKVFYGGAEAASNDCPLVSQAQGVKRMHTVPSRIPMQMQGQRRKADRSLNPDRRTWATDRAQQKREMNSRGTRFPRFVGKVCSRR
nr:hypothetical protein CFP56_52233 [Quercus suber]